MPISDLVTYIKAIISKIAEMLGFIMQIRHYYLRLALIYTQKSDH